MNENLACVWELDDIIDHMSISNQDCDIQTQRSTLSVNFAARGSTSAASASA